MLREGDKALVSNTLGQGDQTGRVHANAFTTLGLLNTAWSNHTVREQLPFTYKLDDHGKRRRVRQFDVRRTSRALEAETTVATFGDLFQSGNIAEAMNTIRNEAVAMRFERASDSTPWFLSFGEMVEELRATARYFMREPVVQLDGTVVERWKTGSYEEFIKRFPKQRCTSAGVLEVCACWGTLHWILPDGRKESRKLMRPPLIIQKANSSTVFSMYREK